jgi:hypothetical protein
MRSVHVIAAAVLFTMMPVTAFPPERDDQLQARYSLCMDKGERDFLEEFRGSCDALCIHQPHRSEQDWLERQRQVAEACQVLHRGRSG